MKAAKETAHVLEKTKKSGSQKPCLRCQGTKEHVFPFQELPLLKCLILMAALQLLIGVVKIVLLENRAFVPCQKRAS